jgi:hypothetical protein
MRIGMTPGFAGADAAEGLRIPLSSNFAENNEELKAYVGKGSILPKIHVLSSSSKGIRELKATASCPIHSRDFARRAKLLQLWSQN